MDARAEENCCAQLALGKNKLTLYQSVMALIKCHECGEAVSDQARTCPKCGAPVLATIKRRRTRALIQFVITLIFCAVAIFYVWKFVQRLQNDTLTPLKTPPQEQSLENDFQEKSLAEEERTPPLSPEIIETVEVSNPVPPASTELLSSNEPAVLSENAVAPTGASVQAPKDLTKALCVTNLRAVYDAALRVARRTKPNLLPVDLMELRTEFTNASVLICPRELPSISSSLDWESFDPKLISYPVHVDLLRGLRAAQPKADYHYLKCPIHKIGITGGRQIQGGDSTSSYGFPHR